MRIYVAGPMSGLPKFNFPAFERASKWLRKFDFDVVSPAELDDPEFREWCLTSDGELSSAPERIHRTWGDLLARDVKLLADEGIEAIFVLPGWQKSRGARLETFVGSALCGLPVYRIKDMERAVEATDHGADDQWVAPVGRLRLLLAWGFGR